MSQTNKESTAEEKGAAFLQWVADNEKEMRKALKKNCTYDPDIFDDVFSETIVNVYNTITKNNREIDNIKNYFSWLSSGSIRPARTKRGKSKRRNLHPIIGSSSEGLTIGNTPPRLSKGKSEFVTLSKC